jgi:hypothetical protein
MSQLFYRLIPDAMSAPMYSLGEAERLGWNLTDRRGENSWGQTLQRNKPGNAGRLRKIRNTVLLRRLGILIPCTVVFAQAPDNSKTNQQDRGSATANQQAGNQGDRDLARKP